jgi:hypothetical protein
LSATSFIPATIVFVNGLVEFSWMLKMVFPAAFVAALPRSSEHLGDRVE